jgi:hypothetical protein
MADAWLGFRHVLEDAVKLRCCPKRLSRGGRGSSLSDPLLTALLQEHYEEHSGDACMERGNAALESEEALRLCSRDLQPCVMVASRQGWPHGG